MTTIRGYDLSEVVSALQKAIRRGDGRLAGYWAIEMWESGYDAYVWRRLLTTSAEDCWGILTQEIIALHQAYQTINKGKKERRGRIFVAKATLLLSQARKCRDADHLTNLVYDAAAIPDAELEAWIDEARKNPESIPDYAFDVHTAKGKRQGKTKADFFRDEFKALKPREPGLFDDLAEGC
jgi:replication-associated recombination protein RarA